MALNLSIHIQSNTLTSVSTFPSNDSLTQRAESGIVHTGNRQHKTLRNQKEKILKKFDKISSIAKKTIGPNPLFAQTQLLARTDNFYSNLKKTNRPARFSNNKSVPTTARCESLFRLINVNNKEIVVGFFHTDRQFVSHDTVVVNPLLSSIHRYNTRKCDMRYGKSPHLIPPAPYPQTIF